MDFSAFIDASKQRNEEKEVKFKRIKDAFRIRTITEEENNSLRKKYTIYKKNAKGIEVPDFDSAGYSRELVATAVVYPDLSNAELQEQLGTQGSAVDTLSRILLAGEFQLLQSTVLDFSGFNEDLEEIKKEVKNG